MDEIELHETYVEVTLTGSTGAAPAGPDADPDAEAYLWVCACGEGDDELLRVDAYLEARRHARLAG